MKSFRLIFIILTIVLALSRVHPVPAVETAGKVADEKINSLLTQIKLISAKEKRLNAARKSASNEERLVIKLQMAKLWRGAEKTILQLADELIKLEKTSPQLELRRQVESVLSHTLASVKSEIEKFKKRINVVREQRRAAPPDQRYALELRIVRMTDHLDVFLGMNYHLLEKMTKIGMDTDSEYDILKQRLGSRILLMMPRLPSSWWCQRKVWRAIQKV